MHGQGATVSILQSGQCISNHLKTWWAINTYLSLRIMLKLGAPHNVIVCEAPLAVLLVHVVSVSFGTKHIKMRGDMVRDGFAQIQGIIMELMIGSICNNIKPINQSQTNS